MCDRFSTSGAFWLSLEPLAALRAMGWLELVELEVAAAKLSLGLSGLCHDPMGCLPISDCRCGLAMGQEWRC